MGDRASRRGTLARHESYAVGEHSTAIPIARAGRIASVAACRSALGLDPVHESRGRALAHSHPTPGLNRPTAAQQAEPERQRRRWGGSGPALESLHSRRCSFDRIPARGFPW